MVDSRVGPEMVRGKMRDLDIVADIGDGSEY